MKTHPQPGYDDRYGRCAAAPPAGLGIPSFQCTRPVNHPGSHMANGGSLYAIWDDDLAWYTGRAGDRAESWWEHREVPTPTKQWVKA